jgi:hypothetical protein
MTPEMTKQVLGLAVNEVMAYAAVANIALVLVRAKAMQNLSVAGLKLDVARTRLSAATEDGQSGAVVLPKG